MVLDAELQADAVHGEGETERTGLAHGTALAQRAVHRFDDAGLAAAFGAGPVGVGRKHSAIRLPLIGEIPRARVIMSWQRPPEPTGCCRTTGAQHPRDNAPGVALDSQPQPHFAALAAHKRPHLIQF